MKNPDKRFAELMVQTGPVALQNEKRPLVEGARLLGEILEADCCEVIRLFNDGVYRMIYRRNEHCDEIQHPEVIALITSWCKKSVNCYEKNPSKSDKTLNFLYQAESVIIFDIRHRNHRDIVCFGWANAQVFSDSTRYFLELAYTRLLELAIFARTVIDEHKTASRFNAIVETVNQAIVLIDNNGHPGWVNERAAAMLQLSHIGEVPPQRLATALLQFRNRADNKAEIEERAPFFITQNNRTSRDWYWNFKSTLGKIFRVSVADVDATHVSGKLWVFDDVTFSYEANARLVDLNNQLKVERQRADNENQAKTDFLSNMSHEIRTPMNGILGITYLLEETELNDEQEKYVSIVKESAQNLLVIINDILDYNKIIAGKIELENIPFDVNKVVQNAVHLLQYRAEEKKLSLEITVDPQFQKNQFLGDPYRLSQVLINILGNAIKFTNEGFIQLKAELIEPNNGTWIHFTVTDSGIGMTPEQVKKLFQRYQQADVSTTRKYGGTGLGMSITRQLVELAGGSIEVVSQPGQGSAFTVRIPTEKIKPQYVSTADQSADALLLIKDKRILVVDDNKINQKVAAKTLENWGLRVSLAENGLEAIEIARKESFDLILMDIHMPVMDGLEATQRIRSLSQSDNASIPIIALTASTMNAERDSVSRAGMNAILMKPFHLEDLYHILVEYLTKEPSA
ncbi:MAG TPA: ATP-binding protein [Luteibaculaceae bacterium]|nr:ATP-binding protein [Luteibaculaceae bacterium]